MCAGAVRIAAHHGLRAAVARVAARGGAARRRVHGAVRRQLRARRAARARARPAQAQHQLQLPRPLTVRRQVNNPTPTPQDISLHIQRRPTQTAIRFVSESEINQGITKQTKEKLNKT